MDTFLTQRKRKEATLEAGSLPSSCSFSVIIGSRGGAEELGGENMFESGQPGFDYQSCPSLGPGNSSKLLSSFIN